MLQLVFLSDTLSGLGKVWIPNFEAHLEATRKPEAETLCSSQR